jgi:hypothetical protein
MTLQNWISHNNLQIIPFVDGNGYYYEIDFDGSSVNLIGELKRRTDRHGTSNGI